MNTFTYEANESQTPLETYEWDNTWIEQANRSDTPRVLYVGDSISCGIRRIATERSGGAYLFDGFGSSKAVDHPYLAECIRIFALQENRRDAILFNNGLHGWHLDDEAYRSHYEQVLQFFLREYPETPLYLVLTTSVQNEDREARAKARNAIVLELAEKYKLPVIDLYGTSAEYGHLRSDGVHLQREGYEKLADVILSALKKGSI